MAGNKRDKKTGGQDQDREEPRRGKCTPEQRQEILAAFTQYVDDVSYPIIAEFLGDNDTALAYNVTKANLSDWPEFAAQMRRAYYKQETWLVQTGQDKRNAAFNMFLLKQPWIGYQDRVQQDITTEGQQIQFINAVPRPPKDDKGKK